ncbi:MAG: glycosyl transferase family 2, partial [Verrucomicrobia bacterium]|nr:glycosyl transferase family 2 [Verrucomicrobiota bacterium]
MSYFFVVIGLSAYGLHRYLIIYLYLKNRHRAAPSPKQFSEMPVVTIQLPIYNELYVVQRLLTAVGKLDYPRDKLEIQVLDDSTDETSQLSQAEV